MSGKAVTAVAAAAARGGTSPCVAVCGSAEVLPGMVRRTGPDAAFFRSTGNSLAEPDALAATEMNLGGDGREIAGLWAGARGGGIT